MQVLGNAPDSYTPEQILQQFGTAIGQVISASCDPQYEFERNLAINKARRNWQMVIGNQFLIPGIVNTPYGEIADYLALDSPTSYPDTGAQAKFCYAINVLGGDLYKFMAVMGNSAPRVKAVADDPTDTQEIQAAQDANAVVRDLWLKWKADELQRVLAFHQFVTGPSYLRTIWVRDAKKYGQTVEPSVDTTDQPQDDGSTIPVPQMGQPQVYVNGDVEIRVHSLLEVKHPYLAKNLDECFFLSCEEMRSKWALLDAYKSDNPEKPGPLEKYRIGEPPDDETPASSVAAAEARESVVVPSGLGRPQKPGFWRFNEWWIQPYIFESIEDEKQREIFKRHFPDGMYVARVGTVNVAIDNRDVSSEWAVCKTGRGEHIVERPIMDDGVPIQRALNDLYNMAIETILRAITQTIVDSALLDRESLASKEALPAEIILTPLPTDTDISKRIYQIPPTRLTDQAVPLLMQLRAAMQDITGIRPELSGGGQPTQTYREAKQRKDQALLQLSPQAQAEQSAWVAAGTNGVKLRAKFGTAQIKSPRKGAFGIEIDVVDLANLKSSGWHIEGDDSFPMNASDRFDKLWGLLHDFSPEVQQMLSILDPINLEQTLEILQIPDFKSVSEDQKQKTMGDIFKLLQGQPQQGEDGSMEPSLPIDDYDDHQFVSTFLPVWMRSRTGEQQKDSNPGGFANVEAFWQKHQAAAQPPAPPPPPPVRPSLSVSAKLEDMPPAFTQEILEGAGLPANPDSAPVPPPPMLDPNSPQAPAPPQQGAPEAQQAPLPPPSDIPMGPQDVAIQ